MGITSNTSCSYILPFFPFGILAIKKAGLKGLLKYLLYLDILSPYFPPSPSNINKFHILLKIKKSKKIIIL